jgi:hypothetical protein
MGPQVRMAGSLSINKRKTFAKETRRTWTPGMCRRRAVPQPPRSAAALRGADCIATGTFTVLPDDGRMDLAPRRTKGPRRDAANRL